MRTISLSSDCHETLAGAPVFRAALAHAIEHNRPQLAALMVELLATTRINRSLPSTSPRLIPSLKRALRAYAEDRAAERPGTSEMDGTILYNVSPDRILHAVGVSFTKDSRRMVAQAMSARAALED